MCNKEGGLDGSTLPSCSAILTQPRALVPPTHTRQPLPRHQLSKPHRGPSKNQNAELCDWVFTVVVTVQISTSCFLFNSQLKAQRCTWHLPHTCVSLAIQPMWVSKVRLVKMPAGLGEAAESQLDTTSAQCRFSSHQCTPVLPNPTFPRTSPVHGYFFLTISAQYRAHKHMSTFQMS